MHMKELVEAGFVGEVLALHVSLMREGVLSRPSNRTWQRDAALGANTLTIANGHTVDAMRLSPAISRSSRRWWRRRRSSGSTPGRTPCST